MRFFIFAIFFFQFLFSCTKDASTPVEYTDSEDYFGLNKGLFVAFEVTEIQHVPQSSSTVLSDTLRYYIKHYIKDTMRDEFNNLIYIYEVKKKNQFNEPWSISDVWTASSKDKNSILVIENQPYIKLKSPVHTDTKWDPNIFNTSNSEEYFYQNINSSKLLNSILFDSTVTVKQCEERNLIKYCKKEEIYSKGIGMVYKYYKDLDISNFDTLNIKGGSEFYYTPIEYGFE